MMVTTGNTVLCDTGDRQRLGLPFPGNGGCHWCRRLPPAGYVSRSVAVITGVSECENVRIRDRQCHH